MKNIRFLVAAAICGLVMAFAANVQAKIKPASATVVRVQGVARYSLGDNQWHPLVAGQILHAGAVIQTAVNSSADLVLAGNSVQFPQASSVPRTIGTPTAPLEQGYTSYTPKAEQNVIRMGPDSILAIDKLTVADTGADSVSDTELDLRAGRIYANVKKMSAASQYIIKIPNGVAGIRGSCGSLGADGSVQWLRGEIVLSVIGSDGQPHTVTVDGGFAYNPHTGKVEHLSRDVRLALEQLGVSVQTLYVENITFANDVTTVFVSPTRGFSSTGGGGGGGS
jgi:FecR protein